MAYLCIKPSCSTACSMCNEAWPEGRFEQTRQSAREWYAQNSLACAADARSGAVRVNDLAAYLEWCQVMHDKALAGSYDHTFAVRQRAEYIRTGECRALLP